MNNIRQLLLTMVIGLMSTMYAMQPGGTGFNPAVHVTGDSSATGRSVHSLTTSQLENCPSCLEALNPESHVLIRCECRHNFHLDCILPWIGRTENENEPRGCPMCRTHVTIYDPIEFDQNNQYRLVGSNRAPTFAELRDITILRALTNVTVSNNQRPQRPVPVPRERIAPIFQRPAEPELPVSMVSREDWEANRRAALANGQPDIGPYPGDQVQQGPNNAPAGVQPAIPHPVPAVQRINPPVIGVNVWPQLHYLGGHQPAPAAAPAAQPEAGFAGMHFVPEATLHQYAHVIQPGEWQLGRDARRHLNLPDIGDYPGDGRYIPPVDAFGHHDINIAEQVNALIERVAELPQQVQVPAQQPRHAVRLDALRPAVAPQPAQQLVENKESFSTLLKRYLPEMLGGLFCGYVISGELQANKDEEFSRVLGARRVLTYGPALFAANMVLKKINPQRTWDIKNFASWGVGIAAGLLLPYMLGSRSAPAVEQNERQRQ